MDLLGFRISEFLKRHDSVIFRAMSIIGLATTLFTSLVKVIQGIMH
jgi:hypothetical protein